MSADALGAAGLPDADGGHCADLITQADLTGADGHGIFRLPKYVRRLKAGGFNKQPNITVSRSAPSPAIVDGDNGMGHLGMSRAAAEAIAIARGAGASWVGVRRSNHAGPAGLYAEMPAAQGMIALYAAVANANHMATWGGADLLLGTNPLAIGVPTGDQPLVFDMATSIVAYGTVKKYALRGLTMPEGWFVDAASGAPITDPAQSAAGLLLPMGEYKGSGLALMIGLIAGVLNSAAFGRDVIDFNADDKSETNTRHFIAAVYIARFGPYADGAGPGVQTTDFRFFVGFGGGTDFLRTIFRPPRPPAGAAGGAGALCARHYRLRCCAVDRRIDRAALSPSRRRSRRDRPGACRGARHLFRRSRRPRIVGDGRGHRRFAGYRAGERR